MSIPGVTLVDEITPQNNGSFAMLDDQFLRGSFRVAADHTARDVITADRRKQGMVVVTLNDGLSWQLGSDLTTWTAYAVGTAVATTGDLTIAVTTTGTDRAFVYTSGDQTASPFLTIAGALAAVPPINNHKVIVNVGAGTFASPAVPALFGSGTLRIIGATSLATLTTGNNSGIAGAGTSYNQLVKPTGSPNWTVNELRGKWMLVTSGPGTPTDPTTYSCALITGNTGTVASFTAPWTTSVDLNFVFDGYNIDNTTHFQIVDLSTIVACGVSGFQQSNFPIVGMANGLSLERLHVTDGGTNTGFLVSAKNCAQLCFQMCELDASAGADVDLIYGAECARVDVFACRLVNSATPGAAARMSHVEQVFAFSNNIESSGAFLFFFCSEIVASGCDFRNCISGDGYCYEMLGGGAFVDYGTNADTVQQSIYLLNGCQSATIYSLTCTGVSRYILEATPVTAISLATKTQTGALGALLLDGQVVSSATLLALAMNDVLFSGLIEFTYTGA